MSNDFSELHDWDSNVDDTPEMSDQDALQDPPAFLKLFGLAQLPRLPTTSRLVQDLLDTRHDFDVWRFSINERVRLAAHIQAIIKEELDEKQMDRFEILTKRHAELRVVYGEARAAVSLAKLPCQGLLRLTHSATQRS